MGRNKRETGPPEERSARVFSFRQCPGCSYDFITGEGTRSCNWFECPYLPEEFKVFCPECNFDFATGEGSPRCSDPPSCDWSVEGYRHAKAAKRFFRERSLS